MTTVVDVVRLHPATLDNAYAVAEIQAKIRRSAKRSPTRPRVIRSSTIQVYPDLWRTAWSLCDGDVARIQIVSDTEVIVHNSPFSH